MNNKDDIRDVIIELIENRQFHDLQDLLKTLKKEFYTDLAIQILIDQIIAGENDNLSEEGEDFVNEPFILPIQPSGEPIKGDLLELIDVDGCLYTRWIDLDELTHENFSDDPRFGNTLFFDYKQGNLILVSKEVQAAHSIETQGLEVFNIPNFGIGFTGGSFE
jgi:hypothetical protein